MFRDREQPGAYSITRVLARNVGRRIKPSARQRWRCQPLENGHMCAMTLSIEGCSEPCVAMTRTPGRGERGCRGRFPTASEWLVVVVVFVEDVCCIICGPPHRTFRHRRTQPLAPPRAHRHLHAPAAICCALPLHLLVISPPAMHRDAVGTHGTEEGTDSQPGSTGLKIHSLRSTNGGEGRRRRSDGSGG